MLRRLISLALVPWLALTSAWAGQDAATVRRVVENFLTVQTRGLPGQVSFTVGHFDGGNLQPCSPLEAYLPGQNLPWGRVNIGVRCLAPGGWQAFVPAQIKVMADYYVSAAPLGQGQTLMPHDLLRRRGDLGELPPGIVTDPQQAIGRATRLSVAANQPMRQDMLVQPPVIQQNQQVKVIARGRGFQVASEGRALNHAALGQVAQVRTDNGQTVSGIARGEGVVEIRF